MKIIVRVCLRHEDHLVEVARDTICTLEDPLERDFSIKDSWRVERLISGGIFRRGLQAFVVSADSGAETGRLLIDHVELPHDTPDVDGVVQAIREIVLEAFERF